MLLLGLDFETVGGIGGPDMEELRVIEVGLALWDVEAHRAVQQTDFYVQPEKTFTQQEWDDVGKIHGITEEFATHYGASQEAGLNRIYAYANRASAIVAHNGNLFDIPVLKKWSERHNTQLREETLYVDTRLDVPVPMKGKLGHIAADHGFLNPFAHQALSDVMTMLRILDTYDIPTVIERAKIPNVLVEAKVSFERKDEAKDRGYYWRPFTAKKGGQWLKMMKECDYKKELEDASFDVKVVPE